MNPFLGIWSSLRELLRNKLISEMVGLPITHVLHQGKPQHVLGRAKIPHGPYSPKLSPAHPHPAGLVPLLTPIQY